MDSNQAQITENEAEIEGLKTKDVNLESEDVSLREKDSLQDTDIVNLIGFVQSDQWYIDKNESDIADLNTDLENLVRC